MKTNRIAVLTLVLAAAFAAAGGLCFAADKAKAADSPSSAASAKRPMTIDDIFDIEGIGTYYGGPYAFSPDGKAVAFTRVRAKKTLTNHKWEYLWGNAGSDVWLQRAPGEKPVNLTNGLADSSGWWGTQWSPSGKSIAMLSTRGGNVGLWLWSADGKPLRKLTTRGVDLVRVRERPFLWVDDKRIVCPVLAEGLKPFSMMVELNTPEIATREWPKTARGNEPAVSVLESGIPVDLSKRKQGQLLLIDTVTGTSQVIVEQNTQAWQLAPGGRAVAYCRQVGMYLPKANEALPLGRDRTYTVEVRRLDGTPVKPDRPLPTDALTDSLRWSADGKSLAFFSYTENHANPPRIYRINAETGHVDETDLGDLDAAPAIRLLAQLEWTSDGDLILLAAKREGNQAPSVTARRDWWLLTRDGKKRCLSDSMKSAPPELWPQEGRSAFFGLADGKLWRIHPASGAPENLTAKFDREVTQISWPRLTNNGNDEYPHDGWTYDRTIFSVRKGDAADFFLLNLKSGEITPLKKPSEEANLMAFSPATGSAMYSSGGQKGTFIWRTSVATGSTDELMTANAFLKNLVGGDTKAIQYTSLNGQKLNGWIILPYGYQPGKRYPTITWVYAGSVYHEQKPWAAEIEPHSLSMQIPASHGFAILLPSMPLKQEGETEDPMLRLTEGVLPAVDKAVELGISDPDRVFVMGQSFGGFSTYGLVTQTNRFKSAIALAGLSNLISLYGGFDARERYTDFPHEDLFMKALTEGAQVGMGNPPWKDLGRYIRNSPIFFVDRVQTPVMIIQGDVDYVALQQGEEFFSSLYRQGKRAEFVRYWGEGHVLESPANIRDMWTRIYAWLDDTGNMTRDAAGSLVFEGDHVKPRVAPKPEAAGAASGSAGGAASGAVEP